MDRKPTFAGKADKKDELDILFRAYEKTPFERLKESWRLTCQNYGIDINTRLDKTVSNTKKRP